MANLSIKLTRGPKLNIFMKSGIKGPPGTTDYNELQNKPDLSIYASSSVIGDIQTALSEILGV